MSQIEQYLMGDVITGLVFVSIVAALIAVAITWTMTQFFEVLESDEKGTDR